VKTKQNFIFIRRWFQKARFRKLIITNYYYYYNSKENFMTIKIYKRSMIHMFKFSIAKI